MDSCYKESIKKKRRLLKNNLRKSDQKQNYEISYMTAKRASTVKYQNEIECKPERSPLNLVRQWEGTQS